MLSHMWEFLDIRAFTIEQLFAHAQKLEPVTMVVLGKEYKVLKWLKDGYKSLADRQETISIDEAKRLGLETAIRVFHLRENFQKYCSSEDQNEPLRDLLVMHTFGDELMDMKSAELAYSY